MTSLPLVVGAGVLVGLLYGLFGVGSAIATPLLAVAGVPGLAAVVGPLPALVPGSMGGAWAYWREGKVDRPIARRTITGALPAAVVGALFSRAVSGPTLVVASGAMLLAIGVRIMRTPETVTGSPWAERHPALLVAAAVVVGFLSGLMSNGGGFLLVPLFLLGVGLDMNRATGTSLVVASALSVPTVITHAALGDINWAVAAVFAVGLLPGVRLGVGAASRLPTTKLRPAFGALLVGFALWFLVREVPQLLA